MVLGERRLVQTTVLKVVTLVLVEDGESCVAFRGGASQVLTTGVAAVSAVCLKSIVVLVHRDGVALILPPLLLPQLLLLLSLLLLIVQCQASSCLLLSEWVHADHVRLRQVVLVLDPVLYQVLKLLHLDLDDVLVDIGVARSDCCGGFVRGAFFIGVKGEPDWRRADVRRLFALLNALSERVLFGA